MSTTTQEKLRSDRSDRSDRQDSSSDEEKRSSRNVGSLPSDGTASTSSSLKGEDVLALQDLDPALNMKMHLVNNVRPVPSFWHMYVASHLTNKTGNRRDRVDELPLETIRAQRFWVSESMTPRLPMLNT